MAKPKFTADDFRNVKNDTDMSPEEIAQVLDDGIDIEYGKLVLRRTAAFIADARKEIARLGPEERRHVLRSVNKSLKKNVPKVLNGTADKQMSDNLADDLTIWYVLRGN